MLLEKLLENDMDPFLLLLAARSFTTQAIAPQEFYGLDRCILVGCIPTNFDKDINMILEILGAVVLVERAPI